MTNFIKKYLIAYYQFPSRLAERYAKIIETRLVLRGLDGLIDSCTIGEDLYQETKDWETPDYMPENVKFLVKRNLPFPNLNEAEKYNKAEIARELKLMKS